MTNSVVDVFVIEVLEDGDGLSELVVRLRIITASHGLLEQRVTVAGQLHIAQHTSPSLVIFIHYYQLLHDMIRETLPIYSESFMR